MTELEAARAKLKCLEMVQGTGLDWWKVVRHVGTSDFIEAPCFNDFACNYEFALGVVEGKPVWPGDVVYDDIGSKFLVNEYMDFINFKWYLHPPTHKTVMVELLVEDAEDMARQRAFDSTRIAVACRKALEQLK